MVRPVLVPVVALLLLAGLVPSTLSVDPPCATDPSPWVQVQGVVYIREAPGGDDPTPFVYIETNNNAGLQWGGKSPAGTYEPGGPCDGGDTLLF